MGLGFQFFKNKFYRLSLINKLVVLVFVLVFIPLVLIILFIFFLLSLLTGSAKVTTYRHTGGDFTGRPQQKRFHEKEVEDVDYEELE